MTAVGDILRIEDLGIAFALHAWDFDAVRGASFRVLPGKVTALVGESGSGKSVIAQAIMGILPRPGRIKHGKILFDDPVKKKTTDLAKLDVDGDKYRSIRGGRISMIFQEPMTALNPVMRVAEQIAEAVRVHQNVSRKESWDRAVQALADVAITDPARRARDYPHQLSGGMRQRVMIAMAIVNRPELLIADEPTTALDVTIQAEILDLLREMKAAMGLALLLITHDLGVIAEMADNVAVMYAGRLVETAPVRAIFRNPQHPYTRGLLAAIPSGTPASRNERLRAIDGTVPLIGRLPPGCAFNPRCPERFAPCATSPPPAFDVGPDHSARCYLYDRVTSS